MKRIGLIAGMSNESSKMYYAHINDKVNELLGEHNTANILLLNINFNDVLLFMHQGKWSELSELLIQAANDLIAGGADIIAFCCNSAHKVAEQVEKVIKVPFLHILEPTAKCINQHNVNLVGLLGNRFTMEDGFYQNYLEKNHGIHCIVPELLDRKRIHSIIYEELCYGKVNNSSRLEMEKIILKLKARGVKGVILGCTELPMLVKNNGFGIEIFDTTLYHSLTLACYCVSGSKIKKNRTQN